MCLAICSILSDFFLKIFHSFEKKPSDFLVVKVAKRTKADDELQRTSKGGKEVNNMETRKKGRWKYNLTGTCAIYKSWNLINPTDYESILKNKKEMTWTKRQDQQSGKRLPEKDLE